MKNFRFMSWSRAKKLNIEKLRNMYSGPFVVGFAPLLFPSLS